MIWTHVSELGVDKLLAGEVPPADAAAMHDHAESCARCGDLLADAIAAQRAFAAEPPRLDLPIPFVRKRRPVVAPIVASVLAAAAALIFVVWPRASKAPETRTKGVAIVGFFVEHGGQVRRGRLREPVAPGDRIQLFTTTQAQQWLAVVGDDASAKRSVYVQPSTIEPGRERVLPSSIELDDTLGDEIVSAVFCDSPFEPLVIDPRAPPAGCTVDQFTLVKVPR